MMYPTPSGAVLGRCERTERLKQANLTITVIGAAGKMGTRVRTRLAPSGHTILCCEAGKRGVEALEKEGIENVPQERALEAADYVFLAVPDRLIHIIAKDVVPKIRRGATLVLLDPAAAYLDQVPRRDDLTIVVVHPCHPSLFRRQESPAAYHDYFGGIEAKQDLVMALHAGKTEELDRAEELVRQVFAPVQDVHRMTVEQMATLEPATVEVINGAAIALMKASMDEAVRRGVPAAAARAFVLGHLNVMGAIVFGETDFPVSDAAAVAMEIGKEYAVKEDWRRAFEPAEVRKTIERMLELPEERDPA